MASIYAPAEACRRVAPEEFAPLAPGTANKRVVITLGQQGLSAYEGQAEVFRA